MNIVGTGGFPKIDDTICDPANGNCPNQNQFASLCGSNNDISSRVPQTLGCKNDYGFSYFSVNPTWVNATYVSVACNSFPCTFTDSYKIKVPAPGDFSVSSGPVSVSRNVTGGPSEYNGLRTVYIDSFGGFGGTSGTSISLTVSTSGPSNMCPGTNCPSATLASPSVTVFAGGTVSSSLSIITTLNTQCGNPIQTSPNVYNITVAATASGGTHHSLTFPLYVYGQADITKKGIVNIFDLTLVGGIFGATSSSAGWDPNIDLNNDGRINIFDLTAVGGEFGGSGC